MLQVNNGTRNCVLISNLEFCEFIVCDFISILLETENGFCFLISILLSNNLL